MNMMRNWLSQANNIPVGVLQLVPKAKWKKKLQEVKDQMPDDGWIFKSGRFNFSFANSRDHLVECFRAGEGHQILQVVRPDWAQALYFDVEQVWPVGEVNDIQTWILKVLIFHSEYNKLQ